MSDKRAQVMARPFAVVHVAVMRPVRRFCGRSMFRGLSIGALMLLASPTLAYRPFDGTDAAVADLKEVEIEFQPIGRLQEGSQTSIVAPGLRYNYGFAERWEFVVEGQVESPTSPFQPPSLSANGAFLKYVVLPGVLQDKTGVSIATEFGPLLPGVNADPGVGFSWAGIVSQRWEWGTAHFNVEANLTRDQHAEGVIDLILEGPRKWTVRPVLEVFYDKVWNETDTVSGLIGAIWQVRDNLSFDAAFRYAQVNGRPVNEIRAGVTFAFKLEGEAPAARPGVAFGNWGLSR
jgi:hypothetical protein